jgi:uncharacterized membrane protein YraQ (UPF0718 family)
LALSSGGRITLIGALLAVTLRTSQGAFAWLGLFAAAWGCWALVIPAFFPKQGLISPASVFVCRRSSRPQALSFSDSLEKTRDMLWQYGPHLFAGAALAGLVSGLSPDAVDWAFLAPWQWAALAAIVGIGIPLDLIALLPLVVALNHLNAPTEFLVPLVVGLEVTSTRTLRLVKSYLRVGYGAHYLALTYVLVGAVAAMSLWFTRLSS